MESETKIVGYISKKVVEELNLPEQIGKAIKMTPSLIEHIAKHSKEYKNVDSSLYTLSNLSDIINNPEFIYYNEKNKSIEYYKKQQDYVCAVVKITNKKSLFMASVYPVKKSKIDNRVERQNWEYYLKNYKYDKEEVREKQTS